MPILVCVKHSGSFIFDFLVCVKRSDSFNSILLHNIKIFLLCLNFEQVKFWTLINLMNNIFIALVCAKSYKLITSEKNIISVQQLPLCLPLFLVVKKAFFGGVVFQDAVIML